MRPDRSVGAVVVGPGGRYLLVRHASGGHWDHPKGHPDAGESPRETARREILEETGLPVEFIPGFETEASWNLPDGRPKRVTYFLARAVDAAGADPPAGSGDPDEILDMVWLPYREARERITWGTGKDVLDRAHAFLERTPEVSWSPRQPGSR